MIKHIICCLIFLQFFCGCNSKPSQAGQPQKKSESSAPAVLSDSLTGFQKRLGESFAHKMNALSFSGSAAILFRNGVKVIYKGGFADFDGKIRNSDTIFYQIASSTKHLTAISILWLEKRNLLNRDSLINKYLKSPLPYNLTVSHLLNQSSGLKDFNELVSLYYSGMEAPHNETILSMYRKYAPPLKFTPGSRYEYSNINYIILSSIAENLSGCTFEKFIRDSICASAGNDLFFHTNETRELNHKAALPYTDGVKYKFSTENKNLGRIFNNRKGSGGMWSTVSNLLLWYSYLFFNSDYYQQLTTGFGKKDPLQINFNYGWFTGYQGKNSYIYNYGKFPGYGSFATYLPDKECIIVILTNTDSDVLSTGKEIINLTANAK